ncbi:STAS domain-containing protein [Natroniella sulfidigena]|uniref:STAS domain-containing protein n=1 Tax=Natroniella sulfidigena TaxID=723921 RepID=UPI00200AD828|nr:STAS domain-containing protein [Natroniella sulfidigena]MCK8818067.1 STAS domain-containing protein [Natroniella sulfidigena]
MGVEVEKRNSRRVIISPEDKIDLSNSYGFEKKLQAAYEQGYDEIIVDFKDVERIDTSGLGKLLLFYKKLRERNGELQIINLTNDYIKRMFKIIKLNKIIKIEELEN